MAALQSIAAVAGIVYPLTVLEAVSPNQDDDKAETLLEPGGENPLCLFQRDWLSWLMAVSPLLPLPPLPALLSSASSSVTRFRTILLYQDLILTPPVCSNPISRLSSVPK